jgi:hypothetical protein
MIYRSLQHHSQCVHNKIILHVLSMKILYSNRSLGNVYHIIYYRAYPGRPPPTGPFPVYVLNPCTRPAMIAASANAASSPRQFASVHSVQR